MRLSRFFLPILKENPKEAEIVSHRLMLRAGMMRQEAAGIYAWLPLGLRVLKKIEQIVREEMDRAGAIDDARRVAGVVHIVDALDFRMRLDRHRIEAAHLPDGRK